MSVVSTVMVSVPMLDRGGFAELQLLDKDMADLGEGCSGGKLTQMVNVDDWGGTKWPQTHLLLGAFNYLDENAFLRFVGHLPWTDGAWVQVFIKGEWSKAFIVYTGATHIAKAGSPPHE